MTGGAATQKRTCKRKFIAGRMKQCKALRNNGRRAREEAERPKDFMRIKRSKEWDTESCTVPVRKVHTSRLILGFKDTAARHARTIWQGNVVVSEVATIVIQPLENIRRHENNKLAD